MGNASKLAVERFTDPQELRALATFAGPAGMRLLERDVLAAVTKQIAAFRELLIKNRSLLELMSARYAEEAFWRESAARLLGAPLGLVWFAGL